MRTLFSELDEFVAELERDAAGVANQRVRVTLITTAKMHGAIRCVEVVSTAKVLSAVPGHEDFDLVEFRRHMGDLWGHPVADDEVVKSANELAGELRERLEQLEFVVAGGIYQEVK